MGTLGKIEMASACDFTVVDCSDFRKRLPNGKTVTSELRRLYGTDLRFDKITVPGAIFRLIHGKDSHRETLLDDLSTLIDKHQLERIVLVPHTECAVYRSRFAFSDAADERERLASDLRTAAEMLFNVFAHVEIVGAVAHMSGPKLLGLEEIFRQGGERTISQLPPPRVADPRFIDPYAADGA